MIQALVAIPAIISAVTKFSELFRKGKETKEAVTGAPSYASTPEELQEEIHALPEGQKNRWAEIMAKEVDLYTAQNERLAIEQGLIDTNITSKLTPEAASKIAYLRQTTRPWAVKAMVHFILLPFYLVGIDIVQNIIKNWLFFWTEKVKPFDAFAYVFGPMNFAAMDKDVIDKLGALFGAHGPVTQAGHMYVQAVPWVVGIIVSYMGLREIGKAKGTSGDIPNPVVESNGVGKGTGLMTEAIKNGVDLVSRVRGIFGK